MSTPPPQLYGRGAGRQHRTKTEDDLRKEREYWEIMAHIRRGPRPPGGPPAMRMPHDAHALREQIRQAGYHVDESLEEQQPRRNRSSERRTDRGPRATDPHSSRYYYKQRKAQKGGPQMSELDLENIRDMHKRGIIDDNVAREYGLSLSDKGSIGTKSDSKGKFRSISNMFTAEVNQATREFGRKIGKAIRRSIVEAMDEDVADGSMQVHDSEDQDDVEMTDLEDIPAAERQIRFAQADPEAQLVPALNAPRAHPGMFNYNAPPAPTRRGTGFQALGADFVKGGEKFARGFKKVQRKADQVLTGRVQRSSGSSGGRPVPKNSSHVWALSGEQPPPRTPPLSRAQREEQKEANYHAVDSMATAGARAAAVNAMNRNAMRTSPRRQPLPRGQARMDRHENH